ncbi:VOC family protein [Arthrobacter sp. M4]|uniref:VOC family protein n=1 Tax=Arthrobacter sp. M4 TaxID=218160 RepID=UPI001CDD5A8F|nr:VOC family protein [Arthrobacter sp. M4]MCA4132536.1 VOC family protein [Arthrobacter sp. M4]
MTQTSTERPSMVFDHVGLVVPDLVEAVDFYTAAFGFSVDSWEADTDVNPDAIGLPGEQVRLRGAILNGGNARLELHQYLHPTGTAPRRVSDQGIGHFAFSVADIHESHQYLAGLGVSWNTEPNFIADGDLAGRWWVYGKDPWGNVIELGQNPVT